MEENKVLPPLEGARERPEYHRFARILSNSRKSCHNLPHKAEVYHFVDAILEMLFPHFSQTVFTTSEAIEAELYELRDKGEHLLSSIESILPAPSAVLADTFAEALPGIYSLLIKDAQAMSEGDPAASGIDEVILAYPGFYAIAVYRLAHQLYQLEIPLLPRLLTEYAHQRTGIDIHPGAQIGEYFCIDHGTGIVIGQTTHIGKRVKVYQGVTLGALSVEKQLAGVKRHPTIEDGVVIYAGATILGGETVIGCESIIGGNVWLTDSVKPYSKVYHKSQIKVSGGGNHQEPEAFIEYYI